MKTFREYTGGDTVNPYYHSYAGSLLGPGLGQYKPVADLNAQKRLLGPNVPRGNFKDITKSDLENYNPVWRKPLISQYRGNNVITMGPPSSGGLHIIQMLNILENYDLKENYVFIIYLKHF